jgi:carbamoylphosphate synthase small subunit
MIERLPPDGIVMATGPSGDPSAVQRAIGASVGVQDTSACLEPSAEVL